MLTSEQSLPRNKTNCLAGTVPYRLLWEQAKYRGSEQFALHLLAGRGKGLSLIIEHKVVGRACPT